MTLELATRGSLSSWWPERRGLGRPACQRIGEASRHPRCAQPVTFPQRDHDQLAAISIVRTHEDQVAVAQIVHIENAPLCGSLRARRGGLVTDAPRLPGKRYAGGDLRPPIELTTTTRDTLAEPLIGVIGDDNQHPWQTVLRALLALPARLFGQGQSSRCSSPTTGELSSVGTRRTASSTPGMNDSRSMVS